MLKKFNDAEKKIGLRLNITNTQFFINKWYNDENTKLNDFSTMKTSSYVYPGRSMNVENNKEA
ncbi:hypothetical protein KIN20_015161 [Parelaphostrongylus tenuis]|uniref:Uncharacterized protein n=1 Tax=Parelaphostrongylus tenuis TaxID=148309 RepID=A0AAD5MWY1_PARTN|nr:hypothetical protein KIN20_015161 [Parelaphostrongylus tenuis]